MMLMLPASSGLHNSRMFPLEMTNSSTFGELKLPKQMTGSDLNTTVDGTLNSCRLVKCEIVQMHFGNRRALFRELRERRIPVGMV